MTFFACGEIEPVPTPDDTEQPTPDPKPEPEPEPEPTPEISVPTVVTGEVSDVTENSATASLTVTSDGGAAVTVCGIVWDEEANPTEDLPTKVTFDGAETSYTCQLTDLDASTTYYYRAYAINEAGVAYGEEYSFTTNTSTTMTVDVNGITIELALVEGGTFTMGATPDLISLYDKYDADELPAHEVQREKNAIRAKILDEYRFLADVTKNPMLAWSEMEHHAFFELVKDYEDLHGNDYVHKTVIPAMNGLVVVSMSDKKTLIELMNSRRL